MGSGRGDSNGWQCGTEEDGMEKGWNSGYKLRLVWINGGCRVRSVHN